jgi:hypothetical protein
MQVFELVAQAGTQSSFPCVGNWKVTGKDSKNWMGDLVIEEVNGQEFSGFFEWHYSPNNELVGNEYFRGRYNSQSNTVVIQGHRVTDTNRLGLGRYEARLSRNGLDFESGTWTGGGTWEAIFESQEQETGNSWTVNNTATWIEAVNGIRNGGNNKVHTITVTGNVSIPASSESTFGSVTSVTIALEGRGTLSPSANGSLLFIGGRQTIIAKDLTLKGRDGNSSSVVRIEGGTFRMEGRASVTGNIRSGSGGGGVTVNAGTFTMQDNASVSGNKGGITGVYVNSGGIFIMSGGTISSNTSDGSYHDKRMNEQDGTDAPFFLNFG